jgi:hypothetical protein
MTSLPHDDVVIEVMRVTPYDDGAGGTGRTAAIGARSLTIADKIRTRPAGVDPERASIYPLYPAHLLLTLWSRDGQEFRKENWDRDGFDIWDTAPKCDYHLAGVRVTPAELFAAMRQSADAALADAATEG